VRHKTSALAALAAVLLTAAAGCGRSGLPAEQPTATASAPSSAAPGSFASLADVCHGGSATGAADQGITAGEIRVGVMTDVGYTKDPELVNAAKVFTSWCNAAGGIDGRKLVADVHDTQLLAVVPAMTAACGADFALVGGSAALDGLAVKIRLQCLLPDFDAQAVMPQSNGSALQVYPVTAGYSYSPYAGYYQWLLQQAYPDSKDAVGIMTGQSPVLQLADTEVDETVQAEGGKVSFTETYPLFGLTSWAPYAEAIKSKGVRGLVFYGTPEQLISLEQALGVIGYQLDWIDANTDSYGTSFIQLAGNALSYQHNYADLPAVYPLEKAAGNPATEEVARLFARYAPGQPVTLQAVQAFSAWLVFAASAETCGSALTRSCVYDAAIKQTAWTGGGLTAPVDLARPDSPPDCFNIEEATTAGWEPADFGANDGAYRCGAPALRLTGNFPQPLTLADVGKTMSDLK
jgi:Periplasmic binding protein